MRKCTWVGRAKKSLFPDMRPTSHMEGWVDDGKGILNGKMFGNNGRELEVSKMGNKDFMVGINTLNTSRCPIYRMNISNKTWKVQHDQSPVRSIRDHKVPLLGTQCGLERGKRTGSKLGRELSRLSAIGLEMCGVTYILFPWPKNCAWENWKGWPLIHVKGVSHSMVTGPHHTWCHRHFQRISICMIIS